MFRRIIPTAVIIAAAGFAVARAGGPVTAAERTAVVKPRGRRTRPRVCLRRCRPEDGGAPSPSPRRGRLRHDHRRAGVRRDADARRAVGERRRPPPHRRAQPALRRRRRSRARPAADGGRRHGTPGGKCRLRESQRLSLGRRDRSAARSRDDGVEGHRRVDRRSACERRRRSGRGDVPRRLLLRQADVDGPHLFTPGGHDNGDVDRRRERAALPGQAGLHSDQPPHVLGRGGRRLPPEARRARNHRRRAIRRRRPPHPRRRSRTIASRCRSPTPARSTSSPTGTGRPPA